MKIGMISLGCPKNLVDSEVMLGLIKAKHFTITNDPSEAELIIVNTCGFIESAKTESIDTVLQMSEYKQEGSCKYLIMTGCLSQRYADELFENMPEVDAVVGTDSFTDIAWVIEQVMAGKRIKHLEKRPSQVGDKELEADRVLTTPEHFAYLKIAEGCNNKCSYCAIPLIRGPYVSRPYEEIIEEAKALVARGIKELIVVAQDTTLYGLDLYGELRLAELLRDLNALEGLKWIRVMYMYPSTFTDELIEAFAALDKVCKYVDIPLQHASDRLLFSMERFDTKKQVEELLAKLRKRIPGITIRTTFIVGFPGETDEDFVELQTFVAEQKFENAGVFEFSPEEGTKAAEMPDQIDEETKSDRYHELMALQAEISEEIHLDREDQVLEVVVEGFDQERPDLAIARSMHEAPDIDSSIFIEDAEDLEIGQFVKVRIVQGFTYEMVAQLEK